MSDPATGAAGQLQLRLTLPGGAAPGRCVLGEMSLENGPDAGTAVEANARLNLVEGDLWVEVDGPAGAVRVAWPWPADSGARRVQLAPGERLVAAVPLFATDTSAPVFPVPGRYRLTARFHAGPAGVVAAEPVTVACAAGDDAAVRALGHRDVLQSLLSAATLGAASEGLAVLAGSPDRATSALARLALGQGVEWTAEAVRAVAAVMPPHASAEDPRRAQALAAAGDERLRAMLAGDPVR